jgi:hypothetical protein
VLRCAHTPVTIALSQTSIRLQQTTRSWTFTHSAPSSRVQLADLAWASPQVAKSEQQRRRTRHNTALCFAPTAGGLIPLPAHSPRASNQPRSSRVVSELSEASTRSSHAERLNGRGHDAQSIDIQSECVGDCLLVVDQEPTLFLHPSPSTRLFAMLFSRSSAFSALVLAVMVSLVAARQPGPAASQTSLQSVIVKERPGRQHPWPVPGAPAANRLLPRPRVVEVFGGAFTSGPIRGVVVMGDTASSLTEVDRSWLQGAVTRAQGVLSMSEVGSSATDSQSWTRGDHVDVRLTLLADGGALPTTVADEHGGVMGPEAYELTLRQGQLSITGQRCA